MIEVCSADDGGEEHKSALLVTEKKDRSNLGFSGVIYGSLCF